MPIYAVTGARGGIGLEYVRQLSADKSNTVFALVRNQNGEVSALKALKNDNPGTVHIIECDQSSEEGVSGVLDRIRSAVEPSKVKDLTINMLINNAGILEEDSLGETSLSLTSKSLWTHIETNAMGPARVTQALLPLLAPGAIVANIASVLGSLEMVADGRIPSLLTAYSISKAALNMLTIHQAHQLAGSGITVVCIDPGHVKTEKGGPDAVVEVSDSARGVLKTLSGVTLKDKAKFFVYTGGTLPW